MDKVTKKLIGTRINSALALRNIKQKELAKYLEVSDNTVSYFVGGSRVPNTEQLIKISKYLNVSTDYLLGLTDIANTDTKIKDICEYTGLSEESIEKLHIVAERLTEKIEDYEFDDDFLTEEMFYSARERASERLSVVNAFLSSDKFSEHVILNIRAYIDEMKDRTTKINQALSANDLHFTDVPFSSSIRLYYFEAIEALKKIAESYCEDTFAEYQKAENKKKYVTYTLIKKISGMKYPVVSESFQEAAPIDGMIFNIDMSLLSNEEKNELNLIVDKHISEVQTNANNNETE